MLTKILLSRGVILAITLSIQAGVGRAHQVIFPELAPGHSVASFGRAMVASDTELFVGAPAGDGFVEIYRRVDGLWMSSQRLVPEGTNSYGMLLSVHGEWLAVGSRDTSSNGGWPLYVDLFRRIDGVWVMTQRLDAPSMGLIAVIDRMELAAESLIIGSNILDQEGGVIGSRVFSYRLSNGHWGLPQELFPPYPSAHFGFAIAAEADTLVTSDPFTTSLDGAGAISTFNWNGETWVHTSVTTSQIAAPFYFGTNVALCDDRLFVVTSAPYGISLPGNQTGRISAFRRDDVGASWVSDGEDIVPSTGPDLLFGRNLDCKGSSLVAMGTSETLAHGYAIKAGGATVRLITLDPVALRTSVVVIKGDVALSNPYAPGANLWVGKVHVFADAIDPIFLGRFD